LKRPRFLEFFAGAGLVRLALEPEWRCAFSNDVSAKKAAVYRANFGDDELHVGDISDLDVSNLPDAELSWASFPCQDLSLAGWRRGISAPRSGMFWAFWEHMRTLHEAGRMPPVIALENVVGLLHGDNFTGLCEALAALDLRFGALVLDARWFLPQSRPRVFVVAARDAASRNGIERANPNPAALYPAAVVNAYQALAPALQERWVWWDLPEPEGDRPEIEALIERDVPQSAWFPNAEVDRLLGMMTSTNREKLRSADRNANRNVGFLYRRTRQGRQRAEVRFDGLAGCLRTPGGGSSRQTVVIRDGERVRMRLLTPREAARLMGAPDSFQLPERYNDAYRAMGDAVAVPAVRWLSQKLLTPLVKSPVLE